LKTKSHAISILSTRNSVLSKEESIKSIYFCYLRVEGFSTISGDPIFEKYREKLNEKIISKEKIIKEINRQKSRKENDKYCKQLFK